MGFAADDDFEELTGEDSESLWDDEMDILSSSDALSVWEGEEGSEAGSGALIEHAISIDEEDIASSDGAHRVLL